MATTVIVKEKARGEHKPSTAAQLKRLHKTTKSKLSLKQFAIAGEPEKVKELAVNWLHNKKVNVSKPPLGMGRTRKRKNAK